MKHFKHLVVSGLLVVATATGTLHAAALSFWNFDESSGLIAHDSVGSVNGTLTGTAHFVPGAGLGGGGAVAITNPGGLVEMGNNFNFNNSSTFSVQVWVKLAVGDTTPYIALAHQFTGFANGYILPIGNTSGDGCGADPNGTTRFYSAYPCSPSSTLLVNDGGWHQIVGTFGAGVASIYVDGQFQGASNGTTTLNPSASNFEVGGIAGNFAYIGLLDNVGVWDNVLDAGQVQSLFTAESSSSSAPEPASLGLALIGSALLLASAKRKMRSL